MEKMDLRSFGMEELLTAALKGEIESRDVYAHLAANVKNAFLKDRLRFLSAEEEKHQGFIEGVFGERFPGKKIVLPARTPVPLPAITFDAEAVPLSDVLAAAMGAEDAAARFYRGLADRFAGDAATARMIAYLAVMEVGHYKLLELERENLLHAEDYAVSWPFVHEGP